MASPKLVAKLRREINEPTNAGAWTDEILNELLESNDSDINKTAAEIWRSKAAAVAHLVNISEGGSTRAAGETHKNFLALAKSYDDAATAAEPVPVATARASRTREITR